jgi:hypothetical protein
MNKKGEGWPLPSILGLAGIALIVLPLLGALSWGFIIVGVIFLILAIWLFLR